MLSRWLVLFTVALVLFTERPAWAQYDAPAVQPAPVTKEASLPRTHDGLYVSFHAGPSYFSASSEPSNAATQPDPGSREFVGPSLALRFAIGGTFRNRVVFGALLAFEPLLSLTAKDENGEEFDTLGAKFTLRQQGALIDYYFLPQGGFHLLGSLGLAQLAVTRTEVDGDDGDDPSGTYWMLGFGHEWWMADSASFGVLASVTNASLNVQENTEVDVDLYSFGLALTATIN
jgi:hypothetical protein